MFQSHLSRSHFGSSHIFDVSHLLSWRVLTKLASVSSTSHFFEFLVLLVVPVLISTEWAIAHTMHSSKSSEIYWYHSCGDSQISKVTSRPSVTPWVSSLPGLLMSNGSSVPSLPRWSHSQRWNIMSAPSHRLSAPSLHACARSKLMPQTFLARQGRGLHLDRLMAPQPQGPMTQDLLKKTETQDADSIDRSAVLLRFPSEQCHVGVSAWIKKTFTTANMRARQDSLQNRYQISSTCILHKSQMSRICGNMQGRWYPIYS